ncbi:MAG: DUF5989 family protein [Myxococcota bacterium]
MAGSENTQAEKQEGPSRAETLQMRLGTVGELLALLRQTNRFWLTPMVVVLVALGVVLVGLQAVPVVAPFIYALF